MEIIYHSLFKVDIIEQEVLLQEFAENDNVNTYIMELLENVSDNEGDREYIFEDSSLTMKTFISQFISGDERDVTCGKIANRLLQEETKAQEKIAHLKKQIHKGVLIISYVKMTETENKVVISKADYNEFIEEISGNLSSGLPTKKKIFKAFIANVSNDGESSDISKLVTFDSNTSKAAYWVKDFLELEEVRDDEKNTLTAYNAVKKDILNPLRRKKEYKADWLCLSNATIAYFRGEGEFDIAHYRDTIIGNYLPMEASLEIDKLKEKITKLPDKYKFDKIFTKKPKVVKDKFKNTIQLSEEMDLIIKHDVANPKRTFKAHTDNEGRKYIAILSDEGFEYAQKQQG
ncbi:nucleoid-associated protein [Cyclobacterium marinum]|uniref:nucleoid-associated protein n=1 Tax=Cyclobacterium marinum TaxID=104 RepID=UPI0011ED4663|nr:nucleoid-associated protein [Cyclobacterium marinum]MBI0400594.1 hypothetical protein [Cyclobacterium marinum]